MVERGYGRIVNIGSDAGRVGSSLESVYSGAKGGVIAFTKTIAREVARRGVTANTVCPGPTDTPMLHEVTGGDEGAEGDRGDDARGADEAARHAGRCRRGGRVPRLRRGGLHHRADAERQRRPDDGMSEEQLIRDAFDAWNEGGPEAFSKLLPPDIEWHAPPQFPDGGVWHDRESLTDELHEQFGSVFTPGHVELLDATAGPRWLADNARGRAQRTATPSCSG